MKILVYAGAGVAPSSFKHIIRRFKEDSYFKQFAIQFANDQFLKEDDWENSCHMLVFPGGRDIPYHEKLKGGANEKIRNYIEKGGFYFGICAGAYYGAREVEFEKGFSLEVCAQRELAFFPGKAIGPAYGFNLFKYDNENGAKNALLNWSRDKIDHWAYYNGGCLFENTHLYPNIEVLASFKDIENEPAAIIACQFGSGKAILSGVHPEFPLCVNSSQQWDGSLWNKIVLSFQTL